MKKIILCLCAILTFSGCAYLSYMKDPFRDIPAFAKVTPDLYRGGPAKPEGYEILKKMGIKSILNLCQNEKLVSKDVSWAMDNGVIVHHMPIDLYSKPSDEQAISFLKIVLDKSNQPVFVHCEDGRDRTGTMVALYRVVVDNWTIKDAYHEARVIGYWPYHGDEAPLKMFVHQLKDKELYFRTARELMRND